MNAHSRAETRTREASRAGWDIPKAVSRRRKRLMFLVAAASLPLVMIGALLWSLLAEGQVLTGPALAPQFSASDQSGRTHQIGDYLGRPVALLFFGTLDGRGEASLRSLQQHMPEFDSAGVKLFAIGRASKAAMLEFHRTARLDFPLLNDAKGAIAASYDVRGVLPESRQAIFILGRSGQLLQRMARVQPERAGEQAITLAACCLMPDQQQPVGVLGQKIPGEQLPRVFDGQAESLYGNKRAPATVILFLSARCPCSGGYDARVRQLAAEYASQGVRMVAIFSGADESREEIAAHIRAARIDVPAFQDPQNRFADRMRARYTPEAFVLDRGGIVRYHGRIDDSRTEEDVRRHDLRNALDAVLAGHIPPKPNVAGFGCAITRSEATHSDRT